MRIVFMGTPEFAQKSLEALIDSRHEVCAVFTRADMPKNRGMKLTMPPVKVLALEHNIPVYQPKTLKDEGVLETLQEINPDVIVVASYGVILPQAVLDLPKYGCINVHASLLPKYRGASPINAAILDGCDETGITIMQMSRGLDKGDMIISESMPISATDTYATLHDALAEMGGRLAIDVLEQIEKGTVKLTKQDDAFSSYAHMIKTADAETTFNMDAKAVSCHIRGYDPAPGAFGFLGEEKIKLFSASYFDDSCTKNPGEIIKCDKHGLVVQAQNGTVIIREVQLSGKKRMAADACFRGKPKLLSETFK